MTHTKPKLIAVRELAKEVIKLTEQVEEEANNQRRWNSETQQVEVHPQWPYYGGTVLTGTLKRRSMDLSRALIELRKP